MTGTHSRWFSSRTGRQYLGQTDRATDVTRSGGGRAGAEPGEVDPVLGSAAPPAHRRWSELPSVREPRQLCFASASNGIGGRGLEERGFGPPAPGRNAHALCTAGCARLHLDKVWCKWWCSSSSVD